MNAPYNSLFDTQLALFKLSSITFTRAAQFWVHLAERQMRIFAPQPDEHRSHAEIGRWPTFVDHYGRRAHDIDPEHDV